MEIFNEGRFAAVESRCGWHAKHERRTRSLSLPAFLRRNFDDTVEGSTGEQHLWMAREGIAWQKKKQSFPTIAPVARPGIGPSRRGRVRRVAPKQLYPLDGTGAHPMSGTSGFSAFGA